ncbi:MAG: DUF932 domain-containing protein [Pseudonocardiaceae bacterium]
MTLPGSSFACSIHHTSGTATAITEARNVLNLAGKEVEEFELEVQRITKTHVTDTEFGKIVRRQRARPVCRSWSTGRAGLATVARPARGTCTNPRARPQVRDYPTLVADMLTDGSTGGHPNGRGSNGGHPKSTGPHDSARRHGGSSHRSTRTRSPPDDPTAGHPNGREPSCGHPNSTGPHDSRHGGSSHRSSPSPCGTPGGWS